jgi:hypothetical protein
VKKTLLVCSHGLSDPLPFGGRGREEGKPVEEWTVARVAGAPFGWSQPSVVGGVGVAACQRRGCCSQITPPAGSQ